VIVVVPTEIPVTKPVFDIDATPGFDEIHGSTLAGCPEPFKFEVPPTQIFRSPVIGGILETSSIFDVDTSFISNANKLDGKKEVKIIINIYFIFKI
jgi:hypothetical protein